MLIMKKLLWIFIGLFILMVPIMAQEVTPPSHIWDVISGLAFYLGTPEAYVVAVPVVAAFFTGLFRVEKNWPKKLISWGISVVGLVVAKLFSFGFVVEYQMWEVIIAGLLLGLAANGFFSISFIKPLMDKIHDLISNNVTKIDTKRLKK